MSGLRMSHEPHFIAGRRIPPYGPDGNLSSSASKPAYGASVAFDSPTTPRIAKKSPVDSIGADLTRMYGKSRHMPGRLQRLLAPSPSRGIAGIAENNRRPLVLAVSADLGFYAGVLNAASSVQWRTDWARTLNRAIEICGLKSPPIVIYDSILPGVEWGRAFDRLSAMPICPRILLAAPSIDEELWRSVLRRHGYDVVDRAASSEQLGRMFRFAWLSLPPAADVWLAR
jgi:hypothetical protein